MVYLMVNWVLSVLSLVAVTFFVPGFRTSEFGSALIAAGIVGLISAGIGGALKHAMGLPSLIASAALLLVFNTFLFRLSGLIVPGFAMSGFVPAVSGAVALLLVNVLTLRYSTYLNEEYDWDEPQRDAVAHPAPQKQAPQPSESSAASHRGPALRDLASSNR